MPKPAGRLSSRFRKWILIGLGTLAALAGLVTFWLPLPIGLPLLLVGGALLGRHSPHARLWMRPIRRRASTWWHDRSG